MSYNNFGNDLNRENIINEISYFLKNFESLKNDMGKSKGIYVYGDAGVGKTELIKNIINDLNMDSIWYNASDVRNKSLLENLTKQNMSNHNVMSLFKKKKKNIVIVMDEIDGMIGGEKSCISNIIKLIRAKKTKKQKQEDSLNNPIICIGGNKIDKKIKDMMKVCNSYFIEKPSEKQISSIIEKYYLKNENKKFINLISKNCQNDLRKIDTMLNLINTKKDNVKNEDLLSYYKYFQLDVKDIILELFLNKCDIDSHNTKIIDNDRTIASLIWHENVIKQVKKFDNKFLNMYYDILTNICFSDFIDRVTFQKQIWQFNEMTSLMKTYYSNFIFHKSKNENLLNLKSVNVLKKQEIIFTKILTKYSNEFSNTVFIANLCEILMIEKKDLLGFFNWVNINKNDELMYNLFNGEDNLSDLEVNRMLKFIENLTSYDNKK